MTTTNFTDNVTVITADWCNDVDEVTYNLTDNVYGSEHYSSLSGWLTAYNATGVNNADTGNNGTCTALSTKLLINNGFEGGLTNTAADHKKTALMVVTETPDAAVYDPDSTRNAILLTTRTRGGQHGNSIRANLQNYSTYAGACTAIYTHAESASGADDTIGLHAEVRGYDGGNKGLNVEMASYSTLGTMYGAVLHNSTASTSELTHPIEGTALTAHPSATALYVLGNNNIDPKGGWVTGILFDNDSMRSGGTGIKFNSNGGVNYHIQVTGAAAATISDILLSANSGTGLVCSGTYTTGNAIRIPAGQAIAWESTGAIRTAWNASDASLKFYRAGTTEVVALNIDVAPTMSFNGTQVLKERITGWTAATGSATRTTYDTTTVTTAQLAERVKALIDDLTSHGLIGA